MRARTKAIFAAVCPGLVSERANHNYEQVPNRMASKYLSVWLQECALDVYDVARREDYSILQTARSIKPSGWQGMIIHKG